MSKAKKMAVISALHRPPRFPTAISRPFPVSFKHHSPPHPPPSFPKTSIQPTSRNKIGLQAFAAAGRGPDNGSSGGGNGSSGGGGGNGNGNGNGNGGVDDVKKDGRQILNNFKWRDLLDPDPDNILAVGLTGLLAWASVQVLCQLFLISLAILVAALKYSSIAALLLFILITLL